MTEFEAFVAMLVRSGTSHSVHTKFVDGDDDTDEEGFSLPERSHPDAAKRVTVHGGSGMHAEAEFDAAGLLLEIGRLEHY